MRPVFPAIVILFTLFGMSNLMPVTYAGDLNGDSSSTAVEHAEDGQDTLRLAIHAMMINAKKGVQSWRPDSVKEAVALYDSARALAIAHFGHEDTTVARALTGLVHGYLVLDEASVGFPISQKALDLWQSLVGPDDPKLARILLLYGDYHSLQGRFAEPKEAYLRALSILEANPEADLQTYANLKNNLGNILKFFYDYEGADSLLHQALQVWEGLHGPSSFWASAAHGNIASLRYWQSLQDTAQRQTLEKETEKHLRLALESLARAGCPDRWNAAMYHSGLADIHVNRGEYDLAAEQLHQALRIAEAWWGPDHPRIAERLASVIRLDWARGNWQDGIADAERAVRIRQNAQMMYSPGAGFFETCLAESYCHDGQFEKGIDLYRQSLAAKHTFVKDVFGYASEDAKMRYLRVNRLWPHYIIAAAMCHDTPLSREIALHSELGAKAVVLDAVAAERKIAYCSDNEELLASLNRLDTVCSGIANLTLSENPDMLKGQVTDSLRQLYKEKEELETEISKHCSDFDEALRSSEFSVTDIVRALPDNSVLWEFARHRPYEFGKTHKRGWLGPRYLCFTLDSRGDITMVDLGDAASVDSLIDAVHESISSAFGTIRGGSESKAEVELVEITRELYNRLVAPLEKTIQSCERIFVSPHSNVNLLPFEILISPDDHYLVEKYSISYLSTGRDLLKFKDATPAPDDRAVVLTAPDYDNKPVSSPAPLFASAEEDDWVIRSRGPSDRSECLAVPFDPLPATLSEGEIVARLLSDNLTTIVDSYAGPAASESALKSMQSPPRVLHLATHGYFCAKAASGGLTENPLLYSGLILAGANRLILGKVGTESEDGILTSLEASGLNLVGTDLVVLSACRSGMGKVSHAEGLYGLRRAFQHAGARSVIMSMFDVPDEATVTLMERFYTNWLDGQSKSSALRAAALGVLQERRETHGAAHPLYWGGFILAGDPN